MAGEKMISLDGIYLNIGGVEITGFGEDAITIPTPESKVISKKGLDGVAWLKQNRKSQEVEVTVNLLADSESVKVLKGFELAGVILPFLFTWEDLGIVVEALNGRVEEVGELKVGTDMPEVSFKITIKDIIEVKGL